MADRVLFHLASKALESLGNSALSKVASWWGVQDELNKLENTIRVIQARVHNAEELQQVEGSYTIKDWLRRLRVVLYRADDLFDDIFTTDHQAERMENSMMAKVGILISRSDPFHYNRDLGDEIKSISKELEAVKSDMDGLNLRVCLTEELLLALDPFNKKREGTSLGIVEDIIIGRENDRNFILEMLFHPKTDEEKRLVCIPIVGFKGAGKTTLVELVCNDESVRRHFDRIIWVGENFQSLRGLTETKKYLIVLDYICDERGDRSHDLLQFLKELNCGLGSKVIVTTCSYEVAELVGTDVEAYKLGVLGPDSAWDLFKRFAFEPGQETKELNFRNIGKEVIELCGNVPLAIKVIASVLHSKNSMNEWLLVRDSLRSKTNLTECKGIMHVLKVSYDFLPPELKQCFAYCSLFPKGYELGMAKVVNLWMAQGFIDHKDVGNHYFLELLKRNFFQGPCYDKKKGEIISCKMTGLMHDLADLVAGDESMEFGESSVKNRDELIHFSVNLPDSYADVENVEWELPPSLLAGGKIRTLLFLRDFTYTISCAIESLSLERMISRFKSLRALNLENMGIVAIPDSLGELRHLRYLNLEGNNMCCLPDSTVRLNNLQMLNLFNCEFLEELPRDFALFANLKNLVIDWIGLQDLPLGFGTLTTLEELNEFVVGEGQNTGLDSLPALNLRGELTVKFDKWHQNAVKEAQKAQLKDNQELISLKLDMELDFSDGGVPPAFDGLNEMLSCLKLPSNLKSLEVKGYSGDKMPRQWLDELTKLVSIEITGCDNCKVLPNFSHLPHLQSLHLYWLEALEYVENEDEISVKCSTVVKSYKQCYFPALEVLELCRLPELKGWTRPSKNEGEQRQLFPRLLRMQVYDCGKLLAVPIAPKLEQFESRNINDTLKSMVTTIR